MNIHCQRGNYLMLVPVQNVGLTALKQSRPPHKGTTRLLQAPQPLGGPQSDLCPESGLATCFKLALGLKMPRKAIKEKKASTGY